MTVLLGTLAIMIVGPFYFLFTYPLIAIGVPVGFAFFYWLSGKLFDRIFKGEDGIPKFRVVVGEGRIVKPVTYKEYAADFKSRTRSERKLIKTAEKALEEQYGKDFSGKVTLNNIAERNIDYGRSTPDKTEYYLTWITESNYWKKRLRK